MHAASITPPRRYLHNNCRIISPVAASQSRVIPDPLQISELLFCRRAFRSSSNEIKKESSRLLWVLRA
jgi:hypothetical protein